MSLALWMLSVCSYLYSLPGTSKLEKLAWCGGTSVRASVQSRKFSRAFCGSENFQLKSTQNARGGEVRREHSSRAAIGEHQSAVSSNNTRRRSHEFGEFRSRGMGWGWGRWPEWPGRGHTQAGLNCLNLTRVTRVKSTDGHPRGTIILSPTTDNLDVSSHDYHLSPPPLIPPRQDPTAANPAGVPPLVQPPGQDSDTAPAEHQQQVQAAPPAPVAGLPVPVAGMVPAPGGPEASAVAPSPVAVAVAGAAQGLPPAQQPPPPVPAQAAFAGAVGQPVAAVHESVGDHPLANIDRPTLNDCLLGRGGGTNHHPVSIPEGAAFVDTALIT